MIYRRQQRQEEIRKKEPSYTAKNENYPENRPENRKKQALRARKRDFWAVFAIFGASRHEITEKIVEQAGPGYDPQAAVMRWLPLATNATLTPGGSILTRDVGRIQI